LTVPPSRAPSSAWSPSTRTGGGPAAASTAALAGSRPRRTRRASAWRSRAARAPGTPRRVRCASCGAARSSSAAARRPRRVTGREAGAGRHRARMTGRGDGPGQRPRCSRYATTTGRPDPDGARRLKGTTYRRLGTCCAHRTRKSRPPAWPRSRIAT
jgi:hypothetical protein